MSSIKLSMDGRYQCDQSDLQKGSTHDCNGLLAEVRNQHRHVTRQLFTHPNGGSTHTSYSSVGWFVLQPVPIQSRVVSKVSEIAVTEEPESTIQKPMPCSK